MPSRAVDSSCESVMMAKRVGAFAKKANLPLSVVLNRLPPEVDEDLGAALTNDAITGRIPANRLKRGLSPKELISLLNQFPK